MTNLVSIAAMVFFWTTETALIAEGVQGRYFLPFLPILLLAFRAPQLHRLRAIDRVGIGFDALLLGVMMLMDALVLLGCFLTVVQRA